MQSKKLTNTLLIVAITHIVISVTLIVGISYFIKAQNGILNFFSLAQLLTGIIFLVALIMLKVINSTKETNWLYYAIIFCQCAAILVSSYCFFKNRMLLNILEQISEVLIIFVPIIFISMIIAKENKLNWILVGVLIENSFWVIILKFLPSVLKPIYENTYDLTFYMFIYNYPLNILWAIVALIMGIQLKRNMYVKK